MEKPLFSQEASRLLLEMLQAAVADLETLSALYPSPLAEMSGKAGDASALPLPESVNDAVIHQDAR
jgi:hypothetical protein